MHYPPTKLTRAPFAEPGRQSHLRRRAIPKDFPTPEARSSFDPREASWTAAVPCRFGFSGAVGAPGSAALEAAAPCESGRGLPHSKTLRAGRVQVSALLATL